MNLERIRDQLPDYAKDIRINLGRVLSEEGSPGLTSNQIWGTALSCAFSTRNSELIEGIQSETSEILSNEELEAAKAASSIMAMNNIYYRFLHLSDNKVFTQMPASLRMNVIGKPGIPKKDFEVYALAISVLSGCGMCINAHVGTLEKEGLSKEGIQSAVRIAAVINATSQALDIRNQ